MTNKDKDQIIKELQTEIHTLKTIISMMPGNIFWKDIHGKFLGCNNNVAKLMKVNSSADVIGKTDTDLIGLPYSDALRKVDLDVIQNQSEVRLEELGLNADGVIAHFLTQKAPLYDQLGTVIGTFGISLDISTQKQTEEKLRDAKKRAEAANRAKSKFLAMISHELRTPLTSLLGFVSFLEKENYNPIERKQYIQHITDSGSYLLSLINNLLDYNKLESNKYELSLHSFNLKTLITNIINMLSGSAKLKKINLLMDYDKSIPENIMSDSYVLQQILVNLIGNAIKFTEKGHVAIKVKCINQSSTHAELNIAIEDTGVGISLNDIRHVFKRFYQSGNVYTRNKSLSGTGLGLSIVKKLLRLLNSKIYLDSVPNQGSTFYFKIRFALDSITKPSQPSPIKLMSSKKHQILLIEDDTLIQIVHKQMLEELNCEVDIAECANKALDMVNHNYDIIFVDIGLPDMNGFELIRRLKKNKNFNQQTPIIALTGYSEEHEHQQCLLAGAHKVAVKPISKASLGKLLELSAAFSSVLFS